MDRGAWRATVHRVTNSQTRLKQLSMRVSHETDETQKLHLPVLLLTHNPTWFLTWTLHCSHVLLLQVREEKKVWGKEHLKNKKQKHNQHLLEKWIFFFFWKSDYGSLQRGRPRGCGKCSSIRGSDNTDPYKPGVCFRTP